MENTQEEKSSHIKKSILNLYSIELFSYLIYFLISHTIALTFYIPKLSTFSLCLKILIPILFYLCHPLFFLLSFSDPGLITSNAKDSFHYDENKKDNQSYATSVEMSETAKDSDIGRRAKTEAAQSTNQFINEEPKETKIANNSNVITHHQREESKNTLYAMLEKNKMKSPIKSEINSNTNNNAIEKNDSVLEPYCPDCLFEIPLRGKHCKECGHCIATFDHHCTWVSNCIGEHNKYLFHIFLLYHSILIVLAVVYVNYIYITL